MNRRPRVGFFREVFLPPSETFIASSLDALARHSRYEVPVFGLRRHPIRRFPEPAELRVLEDETLGALESRLYRAGLVSPRMVAWARSVDLVHAHMGHVGVHALVNSTLASRPLVLSYYGRDVSLLRSPERHAPRHWHYLALHRVLWRLVARIHVLSDHMRRDLVDSGVPGEKVRIVPLGLELGRFGPPSERRGRTVVLMVGREVEKKGFDDGLRACALARREVPIEVWFLGFGEPGQGPLRRLADELGLEVSWLDPRHEVAHAMREAAVVLVPSRTASDGDQEGTPTVIYEAMASSLPVVATRHAGIPEQVADGVSGLLAAERDVDGLAVHLVTLARDPAMRYEMGRAGRLRVERDNSLAALGRNLQTSYDELLVARTPR